MSAELDRFLAHRMRRQVADELAARYIGRHWEAAADVMDRWDAEAERREAIDGLLAELVEP